MIPFKQFFIEKLILGLEEIITLDGIGPLTAKLDSGNGAYNVLHGEDIKSDGNIVRFTTAGGFSVEKELIDTITINVGAGNSEERPVVTFDVTFGGKIFKDVPFSIGNRSGNNHKVLIGKGFILRDLDALIDVGLSYVSDKQINVEV